MQHLLLQGLSIFQREVLELQKRLGIKLGLLIVSLLLLSLTALVPNLGLDVLGLLLLALVQLLQLLLLQWFHAVGNDLRHKLIGGSLFFFLRRILRRNVLFVIVDVCTKLPCQGSRLLVVYESLQCSWIGGRALILLRRCNILRLHLN